ncbi:MAG: type IV pilus assembly protein PilM [Zetaproteobacteria bacterium]|nr:MAG: type IV pilus assembly protein PilM [Zetaproteobacteria bacterium]
MVGLDISSSSIKLVELARTRKGYALKALAHVALPREAIVENSIMDTTAVQQALLDAVEIGRPSTRNVAVALAGNAVIVKAVQMPVASELELEGRIEFEADQHIPFSMDEVYLDFQILGPSREDEGSMDVLLVACKREVVDDLQIVLHDAGLELKLVDCAVFALENAAEITSEHRLVPNPDTVSPEDAEVHALIHLGATMMHVNITINGVSAFVRDHGFGADQLTKEIQEAHGIGFDEAERMKKERFSDVSPEAVEAFYAGLVAEIQRALDYYSATQPEYAVNKMLISGGGALIPGIADELQGRVGIDTVVLNPFEQVEIDPKRFDADAIMREGPLYTIATGLALRSFDQ